MTQALTLTGAIDRYGGVTIPASAIATVTTDDEFASLLEGSLNQWVVDKRRGLWLTIPIEKSSFIPIAVKNGFIFHHAKHNQIVLTKWLPTDEPNKLPGYMTNYLGVGGFVLNDKNEVLVVKEKYFANPVWKLPGGMVDPLEDIGAAACREVMEECSVKAEFVSIIAFRHRHDALFEGSDMYFIARLKPLSEEIIFDKDEILEARWLPVEEYINDPSVTALNREIASMAWRHHNEEGGWANTEFAVKPILSWDGKSYHKLYYNSSGSQ